MIQARLDMLALPVFAVGCLLLTLWNLWLWQRDRALAQTLSARMQTPVQFNTTPKVSILVAAWNEAAIIEAHINSFYRLCYPHKELILCAGGKDGTFDLAQRIAGEHVMVVEQQPGEGKQRALRKCLQHATGEIIYLTDADTMIDQEAFERVIAPIANGQASVTTGGSRPLNQQIDQPFVQFQWSIDHYAHLHMGEISSGLMGRNCAVERALLERTGGFDTSAPSGTDYTLARQLIGAGYQIHNIKTSIVESEYPVSARAYYRQRVRWLRNLIVIGMKSKDYVTLSQGLFSGIVSIVVMLMPFSSLFFGQIALSVWALMLVQAFLARYRYICALNLSHPLQRMYVFMNGIMMFWLDTFTGISALLQSFFPALRLTWQ